MNEFEALTNESITRKRHRQKVLVFTAAGASVLAILAWGYLWWMDWGMRHMDIGMSMWIMPRMLGWREADLALVFLMWAAMMAAMMLPSAIPVILLVARVSAAMPMRSYRFGLSGAFTAGYLL